MKLLWILFVWPEPDSSAAGFRTLELIKSLQKNGFDVEVSSACQYNRYKVALEEIGIKAHSFQPNDSSFDVFIKELKPEVVVFDRFMIEEQFGWRVKENCPEALRILDTIDLHSLRRARQKAVETGEDANDLSKLNLQSDDAIREISSIYRCDLSLIVSDFEMELLKQYYHIPSQLLALCRFFYDKPTAIPNFEERKNFVLIGNFNHPPNLDSFNILREGLWQKIREAVFNVTNEEPEIHIYGAYPSDKVLKLNNPNEGLYVRGWVQDAKETLKQYRVNLAPLRFGAGIKGKISDGWWSGAPCVATSIAAEGMCLVDEDTKEFGGIIEDDLNFYVEKAAELYLNQDAWSKFQQIGLKIIEENFNSKQNEEEFLKNINIGLSKKDYYRSQNFISKMLWHNQHRSTEYFSRWIELKNQRK